MKALFLIITISLLTGCTSTPVEDMPLNNRQDKLSQFSDCSELIRAGQTNPDIAKSWKYKECANP